jgi:hypothetical protein
MKHWGSNLIYLVLATMLSNLDYSGYGIHLAIQCDNGGSSSLSCSICEKQEGDLWSPKLKESREGSLS